MSRIRADKLVNRAATGAPQLTYGAEVVAGVGLTGAGDISLSGIVTAGSFSGTTATVTNLNGTSGLVSVGSTIKTKGFVESSSSATVSSKILSLDASQGTFFTHTTTDNIGIVSFSGIRTDTAGAQTFGVLITQGATPYNTTAAAGIGTVLATVKTTPDGVGYSTHIRVGGGTSTILTNTAGAVDLLTFIISYDGNTPSNSAFKVVGFAATDFRNAIV